MPNEISITAKLSVSKGGTTVTNATSTDSIDMTGTNMLTLVQNIGSGAYEALVLTDINTASDYHVLIRNKDATNFVKVSYDAGSTYPHKVIPGGFGYFPMFGGIAIGCIADTAACEIEIICCES